MPRAGLGRQKSFGVPGLPVDGSFLGAEEFVFKAPEGQNTGKDTGCPAAFGIKRQDKNTYG